MAKKLKKIASVALPVAAAFIPGIGPLGMALAGAAGGALGGGGLKGALLGGALGGIGGGMFGGAPGASGLGVLDSINSGLYNALNPIGQSITSGLGSLGSSITGGLDSLFGAAPTGAAPAVSGLASGLPAAAEMQGLSGALNSLGDASAYSMGNVGLNNVGSLTSMAPTLTGPAQVVGTQGATGLGGLLGKIKDNPLTSLATLGQLIQSQTTPAGTQSQEDLLKQMQQDKADQAAFDQESLARMSGTSLGRERVNQPMSIEDYYTYGQRPEVNFYTPSKKLQFGG